MKRITALVLAVLMMAAVLTACGGSKDVDLSSVMSEVNSTYSLSGLKTIEDTDALNRYFQIDANGVKQFSAEMSTAASQYTTIVMVEGNTSDDAATISTALNTYYNSLLSTAKSYDADQVAMIEACSVKTSGNFVYLVISEKFSEITGTIEAALK